MNPLQIEDTRTNEFEVALIYQAAAYSLPVQTNQEQKAQR